MEVDQAGFVHHESLLGKGELEKPDARLLEHWPLLSSWMNHVVGCLAAGNDGTVEVEVDEGNEGGGVASSSSTSSLTLVACPLLIDIVKVADLPDFLDEWNISITEVSLSAIWSSESELNQRKSE